MASTAIADVIRERRTINDFREGCPPEEVILEGIDLARWAPNHKHTEPWRFHLIGSGTAARIVELNTRLVREEKGGSAAEAKRERWQAVPGWLAVSCSRSDDPLRAEEDYAACCCAIHNLSLYLWSREVGVKWSTGPVTRHPEFYQLLDINPESRRIVGLLWYGYPARVPESRRQGIDEILVRLP